MAGYEWKEIADLPDDFAKVRDRELEALWEVWAKEKTRLDPQSVEGFSARLGREWAIETGIIEGVYTLDRGITQTLIRRGIDSSYISHDASNRDPELVARTIRAHEDALEGLFAFIKSERTLTTGYLKQLHDALLRHQESFKVYDQLNKRPFEKDLARGLYKTMPNNPSRADGSIHQYCPPEHVASEMDRLIQLHEEHERRGVRPYIEAAWAHHAFTQIHPFQDGNGRVARALASLIFIKREFFPLVVHRDDREKYIEALESADAGNLADVVRLFAQLQKRVLTKAIGMAADVKPVQSVEEAVVVTREMLAGLGKIVPSEYLNAKAIAGALSKVTGSALTYVTSALTREIAQDNPDYAFRVSPLQLVPNSQIFAIAEKLAYDPNIENYSSSVTATFQVGNIASTLVISFHSVGAAFRGLLVAAGYFQVGSGPPIPVCDDVFRINYKEALAEVQKRYTPWLDACIIRGLAEWRRTLV